MSLKFTRGAKVLAVLGTVFGVVGLVAPGSFFFMVGSYWFALCLVVNGGASYQSGELVAHEDISDHARRDVEAFRTQDELSYQQITGTKLMY